MFQRYWMCLVVAGLTGCVSAPANKFAPVSASTRSELLGNDPVSVDVTTGKGLSHVTGAEKAMMTTGMFFGAIGAAIGTGAAMKSASNRGATLARGDGLIDPSQAVADKLRTRLASSGHSLSPNASLRLQLATTNWALSTDSLTYFATLQVSDRMGKVTKGECKYLRKSADLGASNDALLADSGARLKVEYEKAADYCASYFTGVLFPAG